MEHSLEKIKEKKIRGEKIVAITAYDALFANIFDDIVDIILVGDSLSMSFGGENNTLASTLNMMIYHANAVSKKSKKAFKILDMPFGSYSTVKQALKNSIKVFKMTPVDAIKVEGGTKKYKIVKEIVENSMPVMGHIGILPQSLKNKAHKAQGKTDNSIQKLLDDAKRLEEAGAFGIVLEGITQDGAQYITKNLKIPTIGIGSGIHTDGQILVWSDLLGFFKDFTPKFVRRYMNGFQMARDAVKNYSDDVKLGKFPSKEYTYF